MPVELLERRAELTMLEACVDALVEERSGTVVLVSGGAGIGKSGLLQAAADGARRRGARVLSACGTELEAELAFGAVRDLLVPTLLGLPGEERSRLLEGPAGLAAPALGLEHAGGVAGEPLFGLYWLTVNLAETAPLVLVLDDLHWLDEESARFAAYLARRVEGLPLLVLGAARPLDAVSRAVATFAAAARVVAPGPLTEAAVAALAAAAGREGAGAELHRLTGGNPFLVHEALRSVDDAAGPARAALDRIALISPQAVQLARAVALFPAGASLRDAAAVAEIDEDAAGVAADRLVTAAVFGHGERLAFLHPVIRSTVADAAGGFARRSGHARAVRVLRERGAAAAEIAPHLLAGEPEGSEENVAVLMEAAAAARAAAAPRAAARYLERALAERTADPTQRVAMLHELGRLQTMTADQRAEETLRRALEEAPGDPSVRADIALDLAATCFGALRADAAVEALLPVRERGELDLERRLLVDGLLAAAAWDSTNHVHLYTAVADALPSDLPGDTAGQRLALTQIVGRVFDHCEPHDQVLEVALRAIGTDPAPLAVTGIDLGDPLYAVIACGALDEATALLEDRQSHARTVGNEALFAAAQLGLANVDRMRGDLKSAEARCRLALELPGTQSFERRDLIQALVYVLLRQGRAKDAEQALRLDPDAMRRSAPRMQALVDVSAGRGEAALPALEAHRARSAALQSNNPAENMEWLAGLSEALHLAGRTDEALALIGEWLPRAERFGVPLYTARLLTLRGRLGGALDDLERAVELLVDTPFAYERACAQLELGSAIRRAGQRTAARELLSTALDYGARAGAQALAQRATDELHASGARPRRAALSGVEALTPAEARIARLAAEGRTNREIAQHLFLTINTVDKHMRAVFRKVDLTSRTQLTDALAEQR